MGHKLILFVALFILPTMLRAQNSNRWQITHLSGDENLEEEIIKHNEEASKNLVELEEEFRLLKADYARGLITAQQFNNGVDRIIAMRESVTEKLKWQKTKLKQRWTSRENAHKAAERAAQPRQLDPKEQGMLDVFDQAVGLGKVPVESILGAREIILSGKYDEDGLLHVKLALVYCLSQLTNNKQEQAEYLQIADEVRTEYITLHQTNQPEMRLLYLAQQIQENDPQSAEHQARVDEINNIMKGMMDKRNVLMIELLRKAGEAKRMMAKAGEEIETLQKRIEDRENIHNSP